MALARTLISLVIPEEKPVLKYDHLLVSPQGIAETNGRKVAIFVPAAEINRLVLKFGRSDHRPILSMSMGIVLLLVGLFGLIEFFRAMRGYRYELGMVAFGIIGASMIFDSLKQRYFLEVHKKNGTCRLVLSKNAQRNEIEDFFSKVRTIYNYQITEAGPFS